MSKDEAKQLAQRHGYKLRAVGHSRQHPNGYVVVIAPDGSEQRVTDWSAALGWLRNQVFGRAKKGKR